MNKSKFWQFKPIPWHVFIKFLLVANIVTILLPWAMFAVILLTSPGESGWGVLLLVPIWYAGQIIAIYNVIASIAYAVRHRQNPKVILICAAIAVASAAYAAPYLLQY